MIRSVVVLLLFATAPAGVHAQLRAEQTLRAGTWLITAELGGAAFTDFQRVQATMAPAGGEPTEFERRVSARTTATIGARIGYWPSHSWGIRAGVSYAPSTFTVANEESAAAALDSGPTGQSETYASLGVWMADAVALFRAPRSFGRVLPYGIVGGGAVRYARGRDAPMPPEADHTFRQGHRTRAAAVFGIGAAVPLQRRDMLLSFEFTNHLSRTPIAEDADTGPFEVNGVNLAIDRENAAVADSPGFTSNLRLVIALSLPLR